ncbi:MAG: translation initiation factor IF-2 [Deferribacteraceae bacterium]|jgi:translation initiation factor IF-2|nr:translation initiation factor IF-2 [Deferribacteraceae bacterium]
MPSYKLTEVAKIFNISQQEVLDRLDATDINLTVTSEQLRNAGFDLKVLLGSRQKLLAERKNLKGSAGIEIRIGSQRNEEQIKPYISKKPQDILLRKSALNKSIQKVDVMRQTSKKARTDKSEAESDLEKLITKGVETAEIIERVDETPFKHPDSESAETAREVETLKETELIAIDEGLTPKTAETSEGVEVDKLPDKPADANTQEIQPIEILPIETKPQVIRPTATRRPETRPPETRLTETTRPISGWQASRPAEQKPRTDFRRTDNRPQDRKQTTPLRPSGGFVQRDGARTDNRTQPNNRFDRNNRGQTGGKPAGAYRPPFGTKPPQRGAAAGYEGQARPTTRPAFAHPETPQKREIKKTKPDAALVKEDAKKAKVKSDALSLKDLNKTIYEGLSELDIETEVTAAAVAGEEVQAPAAVSKPPKTERKAKKKQAAEKEQPPAFQHPTSIVIGETVTVAEMAGLLGVKAGELVKKLFSLGILATVNQSIDADSAALLAMDYGVEVIKKVITEADIFPVYEDKAEDMQKRPPVVTVMGHVDHGKTSLLDAIRSTSVAEKEAGGITQHIGAYEVNLNGRKITFLDTPGHEAFTSLRARGAQVTDIVILVVAANDGVMPQTKEAIDHATAAGVCIVVAINKIDRPDANTERVKRQLAECGILSEEWGGKHQFQEISAKKHIGITELLELVLLEADMLELKGNPNRPAEAIVIESQLDKQRGPVATILVKKGTLRKGDTFVAGREVGRVRSMYNHLRAVQKEAGISAPVEVMGFSEVPEPGDILVVVDEKTAKAIAELRANSAKSARETNAPIASLTDLMDKIKEGQIKELNIIIKADVQGSLEALNTSLKKLSNQEVKVNVVHDATGGITESDVVLAVASRAIIIGFNVRPDSNAKARAEREKISIELYSVIYKVIEDIKLALEGLLTPETVEQAVGKVEVRQVFSVPKIGKIAGAYVLEGKVTRTSNVRIIRDNVVVFEGKIGSLKRFTEDVKEVAGGYECGLSVERYQDIKDKDILEVYELVQEKRTLSDVAK